MGGQRVGYRRVSTLLQNTARQLEGVLLDEVFEDKASGKSTEARPQLAAMLKHVRKGDTVICHSMDRLARNLEDLRRMVLDLTKRGVRVEFVKEGLVFSGEDNAMSKLMLTIIGAFGEFERELILERVREGVAIAKAKGKYKGRRPKFTGEIAALIRQRAAGGESKTNLAKEYGVSRETLYGYLRQGEATAAAQA
jgi:DNA invertase Pin-like site-specific DNA recombinase